MRAIEGMSPEQKRAYVIADNKLALNAGWDEELLALELGELSGHDLGFDVEITGFSIAEIDGLVEGQTPQEPGDPADDRVPEVRTGPPRCQPGDIWQLGAHRLICGDALDGEVIATLMASAKARMVFTDPPYNVPSTGMSAAKVASGIASSRWRRARCRYRSSRRSCELPFGTSAITASTVRSTSSAWTGAT